MLKELERFLLFMRPAFSRQATYCWFVIVFVGFILRNDTFGVSSIVRALTLTPESYLCLVHFSIPVPGILKALWPSGGSG